jgi:Tfp pilus assembly protein PilO/Tfp pilus assembly protein PilN
MRPVNLIPPEERAGSRKPLRSGPLAYMVVGALAAAVIAITALVVTENSISDKKAEVTALQAEQAQITAKAKALSPYTQFAAVREQRLATVTELANSRFDWARILHELSLVMPADVQLTSLAGNVSAGAGGGGGAGVGLRSGIAGPALEMVGCASGQAGVAAFIEAVKDIDGVTRVGIQGSSISGGAEGEGNATAAGACNAGGTAQFQLVAGNRRRSSRRNSDPRSDRRKHLGRKLRSDLHGIHLDGKLVQRRGSRVMKASARPIIAILLIAAAAIAFWTLALSPKRDEADKLDAQIETMNASVAAARSELGQATAARHVFPTAYHQLVELGQAVPATDETPSLLIELEQLADASGVSFETITLEGEGGAAEGTSEATATTAPESTSTSAASVVPATEVEASLLPLGASIGRAGLAVMPYSLNFTGSFFGIAKFIGKVDDLVESTNAKMTVDGRLLTINGFSLTAAEASGGASELQASFSVTTYLTPPGQGITAGASPSAPAEPSTQTVAAE